MVEVIRILKECDFCAAQIDWTDMRKDAIPNGWLKISVTVTDNEEDKKWVPYVIEICAAHKNDRISNIVAVCLEGEPTQLSDR